MTISEIHWKNIDSDEFVWLCYRILQSLGFKNLKKMDGPGDRGRDIECDFYNEIGDSFSIFSKWIVQCKFYDLTDINPSRLRPDLEMADQHNTDYWLLITTGDITASTYDWLENISKNNYTFRARAMCKEDLERYLSNNPTVAGNLTDKLFDHDDAIITKCIKLMSEGKYQTAKNYLQIVDSNSARKFYLLSCCDSILGKEQNVGLFKSAFALLEESLKLGYLGEMSGITGYPEDKILFEIMRDNELQPLRDSDYQRFLDLLSEYGYNPLSGGGCLPANCLISLSNGCRKQINSISEGDEVEVPFSNELGAIVNSIHVKEQNCFYVINHELICSPTQPVLTELGFQEAMLLQIGDKIGTRYGWEPIISITCKLRQWLSYMISLKSHYKFYAGDYIVHNKLYVI